MTVGLGAPCEGTLVPTARRACSGRHVRQRPLLRLPQVQSHLPETQAPSSANPTLSPQNQREGRTLQARPCYANGPTNAPTQPPPIERIAPRDTSIATISGDLMPPSTNAPQPNASVNNRLRT